MTTNDPYQVYEHNLGHLKTKCPRLAETLESIDMESIDYSFVEGRSFTVAIEGIQLNSRHDPEAEANLRCSHVDETDTEVIVYGYESGYTVRHLVEKFRALTAIHIHILSSKALKVVLHLADHSEVISDTRVKFYYGDEHSGRNAQYVSNPAEVSIADDVNWKKRDGLLYRFLTAHTNKQFIASWGEIPAKEGVSDELANHEGVNSLNGKHQGCHAYVIGAGPTLEKNVNRLKKILKINPKSLVIACDTSVTGLLKNGIRINYIVTTDPEISDKYLPTNLCKKMPLVFGIHTPLSYINKWQGKKYFYLSNVKLYDKYTQLAEKGRLFAGGSVIHPATDLAVKLGCDSVTFLGADFSFPYGKAHSFNDWGVRQIDNNWVLNWHGDRVPTNSNFALYLVALEHIISTSPSTAFFNASKDGARIAGTDIDPTFGEL